MFELVFSSLFINSRLFDVIRSPSISIATQFTGGWENVAAFENKSGKSLPLFIIQRTQIVEEENEMRK